MANKRVWLATGTGICLIVIALLLANVFRDHTPASAPATSTTPETSVAPPSVNDKSSNSKPATGTTDNEDSTGFLSSLAGQFHNEYDERLKNPYWRMKMLDELTSLFKKKYGADWQQRLEAFLRKHFPERADELIQKLLALQEYNQWVDQLKSTMQFASMKDRQAALWEKRVALFGDEAYVIWEAALKDEQLHAKLDEVNASTGSFQEKANLYMNGMREVLGANIIGPDQPHTTQLLTQFLQLPNVQADLQQLPEAERYAQLNDFRRAMGLDAQALQRWDTLDQERAQARTLGERYMSQRATLENQFSGDTLKTEIHKLQDQLFGPTDATFIRNEEDTGFYRFKQAQIIGVN